MTDERRDEDAESDDPRHDRRYRRTYLARRLAEVVAVLRSEWRLFLETYWDEAAYLDWVSPTPVALPERPSASSFPEHLVRRGTLRELENAARTMEREENWYSALELHLEILRRTEESDGGSLDVTLYNRIGDIHRLLAAEWYTEAVDRYTERDLRRGAIALCEKALRLDHDRPRVRERLELLADAPPSPAGPARAPRPPTPDAEDEEGDGPPEVEIAAPRAPRPDEAVGPEAEAPPTPGATAESPDGDAEPLLPRIVIPPADEEYRRIGRREVFGAVVVLVGVVVAILILL